VVDDEQRSVAALHHRRTSVYNSILFNLVVLKTIVMMQVCPISCKMCVCVVHHALARCTPSLTGVCNARADVQQNRYSFCCTRCKGILLRQGEPVIFRSGKRTSDRTPNLDVGVSLTTRQHKLISYQSRKVCLVGSYPKGSTRALRSE
jgi:hypothetical protein